jgi:hypothetical protein
VTPLLWCSLVGIGLAAAWLCGFLAASKAHCDGCAKSGHEVSRLSDANARLVVAIGNWITRAQTAEQLNARHEAEDAEAKALDDRLWAGVQKRLHMEHSPASWATIEELTR